MDPLEAPDRAALVQLRAYLAQQDLPASGRLPPEREFCATLGVSRGELRKALAVLEAEGRLWRRVGKGTFVGDRPAEADAADAADLSRIVEVTSPTEVMRARLLIEPEIAREAALHASVADVARMRHCLVHSRRSETWRQYESWDNRLHRAVAEATDNAVLIHLFDTLNAIRRAVAWGRLRDIPLRPPKTHHSFAEHDALVAAIEARDREAAARRMRVHLQSVAQHLLDTPVAAE